jgi:proteic killer suppression protein
VKIRNIRHKGLWQLHHRNIPRALPGNAVEKLRKILFFLDGMESAEELTALPKWKPHLLTGDRKGTWSLSVTRNWRITFRIEENEICDLNFEDYH